MARSFFGARHLIQLLHVELVAGDLRIGTIVVAPRTHLNEDGLTVGTRLRNEAELFLGVL
jgi:hypothetical protein